MSAAGEGALPEELDADTGELVRADTESRLLEEPELQEALRAAGRAAADRSDSVVVSSVALALGLLAMCALLPWVLGPAGVGLAVLARHRGERFASLALGASIVGTALGVALSLYVGTSPG